MAGAWPVPALQETDVVPPTGARVAGVNNITNSPRVNKSQSPQPQPPQPQPPQPQPTGDNAERSTTAAAAAVAPAKSSETEVFVTGVTPGEVVVTAVTPPVTSAAAAAAARARASTLDLYFRKLMKRAAEVVAELCLRRLQLPGDTADQVS